MAGMDAETLKGLAWVFDCNLSRNIRYYRFLVFWTAGLIPVFRAALRRYAYLHRHLRQFELQSFGFLLNNGEEFIRRKYELEGKPVPKSTQERFAELLAEHADLEATEAFDWGWLNSHCQKLERRSRWGKAVSTHEQETATIAALRAQYHPDRHGSPVAA